MHVLITNDDGPLDDKASPYIKYFIDELKSATNWDISIVIPNQQRSWIGKAHFAGKTLTASYIYTENSTENKNDNINKFTGPFNKSQSIYKRDKKFQEWCLIDSTPAACADIGIHHLNSHDKPIDLVISGPNFGKNSSNLYILSSGTVGASLESCTHGIKSIALSYEFFNLNHDFKILKEAAKISVKLISKLIKNWDKNVDLYSINIPLLESLNLNQTKIKYAPILQNTWNSIYEPTTNENGELKFSWNPDFKKVYKDGLDNFDHSDNRVLLDKGISVTPLKSSFSLVHPANGEINLNDDDIPIETLSINGNEVSPNKNDIYFLITTTPDQYIYKPLVDAFKKFPHIKIFNDISILDEIPKNSQLKIFHYGDYEDINIDFIESYPEQYFIPSYIYRKALIRKHFLANTIHHYTVKNSLSILNKSVPESYQLEVDYAEFLDDSLDDAYELRDEIENGDKVWILKPSMSDKGQGIRLFKSIEQLQSIFDSFEEEKDEDEQEEDDDNNGIIISQLRHFIVQEYQSNPLLLPSYDNKKFHLRTYVVCQGNLRVFVYKNILTLFSDSSYENPKDLENNSNTEINMNGHLTNTCLQESESPLVVPFWLLNDIEKSDKNNIYEQIKEITSELFKAATSVDKINFQPLDNAIEIFGIDFLVNDDLQVNLLEVNSYPDFKQTGDDLKELIYELFDSVVVQVVNPLINSTGNNDDLDSNSNLDLVLQ